MSDHHIYCSVNISKHAQQNPPVVSTAKLMCAASRGAHYSQIKLGGAVQIAPMSGRNTVRWESGNLLKASVMRRKNEDGKPCIITAFKINTRLYCINVVFFSIKFLKVAGFQTVSWGSSMLRLHKSAREHKVQKKQFLRLNYFYSPQRFEDHSCYSCDHLFIPSNIAKNWKTHPLFN